MIPVRLKGDGDLLDLTRIFRQLGAKRGHLISKDWNEIEKGANRQDETDDVKQSNRCLSRKPTTFDEVDHGCEYVGYETGGKHGEKRDAEDIGQESSKAEHGSEIDEIRPHLSTFRDHGASRFPSGFSAAACSALHACT